MRTKVEESLSRHTWRCARRAPFAARVVFFLLFPPTAALPDAPGGRAAVYEFNIQYHTATLTANSITEGLRAFSSVTGVSVSYLEQQFERVPLGHSVVGRFTAGEAIDRLLTPAGVRYEWVNDRTIYAGRMSRNALLQQADAGTNPPTYDGSDRQQNAAARDSVSHVFSFYIDKVPLEDLVHPLRAYLGVHIQTAPSAESILRTPVGPLKCACTAAKAIEYLFNSPRTMYEWTSGYGVTVRKRRWTDPPFRSPSSTHAPAPDVTVEAARLSWFAPEQQPAAALGSEEIERLGVSSVPQLLDYVTQQPFSRSEGLRVDGGQSAELRGLGRDTTIVLIDGYRVRAAGNSYESSAFDLNTIPIVAVERVEFYLDSTPLSVAADAIGGMVNIILKTNVRAPKLDLHYGAPEGGGRERRISITTGVVRESFRATAVFDYFDREQLIGRQRDRWLNQDYRRFGGHDWRSLDSNPGNVSSLVPGNLPGLSSPIAAVPSPQDDELTVSDFLSTAGLRNLASPLAYQSILPETQRHGAVVTFDWQPAPAAHVFGNVLYTTRHNVLRATPPSASNVIVPATNIHNPFGVPVRSNFLVSAVEREHVTDKDYLHGLVGARGEIGGWNWDASALRTQGRFEYFLRGSLDLNRVLSSFANSDPQRSLNVFDDGPGGSPWLLHSLLSPIAPVQFRSGITDVTVQFQRNLFEWYAGSSTGSFGAQWSDFGQSVANIHMSTRRRTVSSAFGQWMVPLLPGTEGDGPVVAVAAQVRVDDISDLKAITSSQFTLNWRPSRTVSVRATYGTSYRAPTLYELYQPVVTMSTLSPIGDPKRGGEVRNITVSFGGNPDLELATAASWSVGLTFAPRWRNRFRLTGTYWDTSIKNTVTAVNAAVALSREDLFAERLFRAPPSGSDVEMGWPGSLVGIDAAPGARGSLDANGIDVQAALDISGRYGRITPELSATWMREFRTVDWYGLPEAERVSIASGYGSIPRWHVVAGASWRVGMFEISANARLISAYADVNLLQSRATGRDVAAYWLVDMQALVRLDSDAGREWISNGLTLRAGVRNLLDREPPFAEVGTSAGFDPAHGDLQNRFLYLRLTKEFQ